MGQNARRGGRAGPGAEGPCPGARPSRARLSAEASWPSRAGEPPERAEGPAGSTATAVVSVMSLGVVLLATALPAT